MLEKEYKAPIDHAVYMRLVAFFQAKRIIPIRVFQVNYYYDTKVFDLFYGGETLRIRQIEDDLKLEYKCRLKNDKGMRYSDEISTEIPMVPAVLDLGIILPGTSRNEPCVYLGNLLTERSNYEYGSCLVSLDKNMYLGKLDYEIEIEFEEESQLAAILREIGITTVAGHVGKYSRFVSIFKTTHGSECA